MRLLHEIRLESNPWTETLCSIGACSGSDRQIDYLNVVAASHNFPECALPRPLFVDVSQNVDRNPTGSRVCPCLTTSSKVFHFESQDVLHATDHFVLMGHCHTEQEWNDEPDQVLRKYIGESMFCGSLAVLIEAFCL